MIRARNGRHAICNVYFRLHLRPYFVPAVKALVCMHLKTSFVYFHSKPLEKIEECQVDRVLSGSRVFYVHTHA